MVALLRDYGRGVHEVPADSVEVFGGMVVSGGIEESVHLFMLDETDIVESQSGEGNRSVTPESAYQFSLVPNPLQAVPLDSGEVARESAARFEALPQLSVERRGRKRLGSFRRREIRAASGKCEDQNQTLQGVSSGVPDIDDTRFPKVTP